MILMCNLVSAPLSLSFLLCFLTPSFPLSPYAGSLLPLPPPLPLFLLSCPSSSRPPSSSSPAPPPTNSHLIRLNSYPTPKTQRKTLSGSVITSWRYVVRLLGTTSSGRRFCKSSGPSTRNSSATSSPASSSSPVSSTIRWPTSTNSPTNSCRCRASCRPKPIPNGSFRSVPFRRYRPSYWGWALKKGFTICIIRDQNGDRVAVCLVTFLFLIASYEARLYNVRPILSQTPTPGSRPTRTNSTCSSTTFPREISRSRRLCINP